MDGPTKPKKRSPALDANKRRANRKSKSVSQRKCTQRGTISQEPERHSLAVYSGQERLGRIEQEGGKFAAFSTADRPLGEFRSLKRAADAVATSNGGGA
jgi:hypothetical protein